VAWAGQEALLAAKLRGRAGREHRLVLVPCVSALVRCAYGRWASHIDGRFGTYRLTL